MEMEDLNRPIEIAQENQSDFSSDKRVKLLSAYKTFGESWEYIEKHFQGYSKDKLRMEFNGTVRKALLNMINFIGKETDSTYREGLSSISGKTIMHAMNHLLFFNDNKTRIVMFEMISKFSFVDEENKFPEPYTKELETVNRCVLYFFSLNKVLCKDAEIFKTKFIERVERIIFRFKDDGSKTMVNRFIRMRRQQFQFGLLVCQLWWLVRFCGCSCL